MTIRLRDQLHPFTAPCVMGILNVTPDSFYAHSRTQDDDAILRRAAQILAEGGEIIDIGACSTRPGATEVTTAEELRRLDHALRIVRDAFPEALISVDTFRAEVARHCVDAYHVDIINDISGGADPQMFATASDLHVPYILTHNGELADPDATSLCRWFAERLQALSLAGVADVILDPGFGFGKTLEQNYQLMQRLHDIIRLFPDNPFLIGISRKSMIYKLLGSTPEEALNGTTVLNTFAVHAGAHILRVHDVREAVETIRIYEQLNHKS